MGFSRFYTVFCCYVLMGSSNPTKTRHRTKQGSDFVTRMNTQKNQKMKAKLSEKQKNFLWCGGMSGKNHYCKSPRKKFFPPILSLRIHWLCNFAHFCCCCCCCGRVFIFIHFSPIIPNTAENVVDFSKQNHFCVVRMKWREKTRRNGREEKKLQFAIFIHFFCHFSDFHLHSSEFEEWKNSRSLLQKNEE